MSEWYEVMETRLCSLGWAADGTLYVKPRNGRTGAGSIGVHVRVSNSSVWVPHCPHASGAHPETRKVVLQGF
jgi:hypothetical protein